MTTALPLNENPFQDHIPGSDIPQADNLQRVRLVINAVAAGFPTQAQILKRTRIPLRHASYSLHAARLLGFLEKTDRTTYQLTEKGRMLCSSRRMSEEERTIFRDACNQCEILMVLAPGLLSKQPPSVEIICDTIERRGRLSHATAHRRARALLSWRAQLLEPQKYAYLLDATEGAFTEE